MSRVCSCCSICIDREYGCRTARRHSLYTTFLASSFRTLRFGLNEAHGKGMALQFNYLLDKGAFRGESGRDVCGGLRQDQGRGAGSGALNC